MNAWTARATQRAVAARLDAAHDPNADTIRRMSYPELAVLAHLEHADTHNQRKTAA